MWLNVSTATAYVMPSVSRTSRLTGQVATTRTITITQPHLTAHSLPCTSLCPPGSATHHPRWHAGPYHECVVSSLPTALPPPPLCHSGSSQWSRVSSESRLNRDRQRSVAACCSYVDHRLLINFCDSIIEYDNKSSLTIPSLLKHVATLPREMFVSKNWRDPELS